MNKRNFKLMTLVLCLLFSTLIFPKNTFALSIPSAPTGLTASATNSSKIYLHWNSVSGATSYDIFRASSSSDKYYEIDSTTTTSYSDDGLEEDTTYYYKVQAVNSAGTSPYSSSKSVRTDAYGVPSAPSYLNANTESSTRISLDWESVDEATSYYIFRATSSGDYKQIAITKTSSYINTGLSNNTKYYYKVKAVNSSGQSSYSPIAYDTTDKSGSGSGSLSEPSLSAVTQSSSKIFLDWDTIDDASSYYIYRATSYYGTYSQIATTTSTSYTNTGLPHGTTYYYKVQAVHGSDKSSYSNIADATTDGSGSGSLSEPTDLTVKAESSSEIYLDWDTMNEASSYYIYRATSYYGTYSKIATTSSSNYTNTGLSPNTTYYYKVVAVNSSNTSSDSSIVSATTYSASSYQSQVARLAGRDLYETCAEVAKSGWNETSYYAIVVSGENFADALCSAPLAHKYNAPILLTSKSTLNWQTELQLSRLNVKNVMIIGGTGIISSGVEESIKALGITVSRIAGNDRYETSIKVAQSMGQVDQAVIASGESFPDALSIAPIASMKGIPILLTPKDNLPENVKAYLSGTVKSTYVVGGTGVVSDNVFRQLPSPTRLSGINRYETNISIVNEFANELNFSTCYVSTGEYFADALAGSALASLTKSPVILVSNPVNQSTIDFFKSKLSNIDKEVVFGGTVVVPETILTRLNGTTYVPNLKTPAIPTNVTASTESSKQINLTWNSVSGATSYYIYRSTSSSDTYTHIATVTTTSFENLALSSNTTYFYKVKAVNSSGSSSFSSVTYSKTY